jgi:hypothetical protein
VGWVRYASRLRSSAAARASGRVAWTRILRHRLVRPWASLDDPSLPSTGPARRRARRASEARRSSRTRARLLLLSAGSTASPAGRRRRRSRARTCSANARPWARVPGYPGVAGVGEPLGGLVDRQRHARAPPPGPCLPAGAYGGDQTSAELPEGQASPGQPAEAAVRGEAGDAEQHDEHAGEQREPRQDCRQVRLQPFTRSGEERRRPASG